MLIKSAHQINLVIELKLEVRNHIQINLIIQRIGQKVEVKLRKLQNYSVKNKMHKYVASFGNSICATNLVIEIGFMLNMT